MQYNALITQQELTKMLRTCSDSAPGEDLITYSMMKNLHPSAIQELTSIINEFWTRGEYPNEWRKGIVLSFSKQNKDPSQKTSYRPIALTSSVGKLVEKIVNVRLVRTLEETNSISDLQFGFRKHRSTVDLSLIHI